MDSAATAGSADRVVRVEVLDLLRLVAVLGVVLFHYGFRGPTALGTTHVALPELGAVARYGFLGVPIFFVISGFVIAYSAEGRTAVEFAIARFSRIYPTFVLCMSVTFAATLTLGAPSFPTSAAQWVANLFIAAPAWRQPYMDSAYWSLVYEVTFYAWVTALIAMGILRKRVDLVVATWLGISLLNELLLDSIALRKLFLTDVSGFFATGILLYELYRGRRDAVLQALLASSVVCAITTQSIYNLQWLREHTGEAFDDVIVAAITLLSIVVIMAAAHVRHVPLPGRVVLGIGGMTYPFYLLHQQIGYDILQHLTSASPLTTQVAIVVMGIGLLSWSIWRFVERPLRRQAKHGLTLLAAKCAAPGKTRPATS